MRAPKVLAAASAVDLDFRYGCTPAWWQLWKGMYETGVDLSAQQPAETANWYAPSMYNIVKQNGQDVHIVIKPDKDCEVNSGLGSVRGARMAEMSYSRARNTELQRLTDPMVWRYGQMQPTSWDDALDLVARVTVAVINDMGEDGLFVSPSGRCSRASIASSAAWAAAVMFRVAPAAVSSSNRAGPVPKSPRTNPPRAAPAMLPIPPITQPTKAISSGPWPMLGATAPVRKT